jgi:hypothetical protein
MESLTDDKKSSDRPARGASVDRVAIGNTESEKLSAWLRQVQDSSKGFLALSKSDLVNFLIREHKADFAPKELALLRGHHYDPIKHINWITQELKTALAKSDLAMVAVLQEEIKGIELSVVAHITGAGPSPPGEITLLAAKKPKQKRTKKSDAIPSPESLSIADLQGNLPEG